VSDQREYESGDEIMRLNSKVEDLEAEVQHILREYSTFADAVAEALNISENVSTDALVAKIDTQREALIEANARIEEYLDEIARLTEMIISIKGTPRKKEDEE
jgi:archaellum component FlaC